MKLGLHNVINNFGNKIITLDEFPNRLIRQVYPKGWSNFQGLFSDDLYPGRSLINSTRGNPEGERGKSTVWGGKHQIKFPNVFSPPTWFFRWPQLCLSHRLIQGLFSEYLYSGTSLMSSATVNSEKVKVRAYHEKDETCFTYFSFLAMIGHVTFLNLHFVHSAGASNVHECSFSVCSIHITLEHSYAR